MPTKKIWLALTTTHPEMGHVVILQRMSQFDPETRSKRTFPGACELTAVGCLEDDEKIFGALLRLTHENLCRSIVQLVAIEIASETIDSVLIQPECKLREISPDENHVVYTLYIEWDDISLLPHHMHVEFVNAGMIPRVGIITEDREDDGYPDIREVWLSHNQLEVIKTILEKQR